MENIDKNLDDFINENNEPSQKPNNKKYLIDNRDTIVEQIERVVIVNDGRQLLCE